MFGQSQFNLKREAQVQIISSHMKANGCFELGESFVSKYERKKYSCHHQVLWELSSAGSNHTLHLVDYFEQGAQVPNSFEQGARVPHSFELRIDLIWKFPS